MATKLPNGYDPTAPVVGADPFDRLGLDRNNPEHVLRVARRARVLRAEIARRDPAQFNTFVLRDERTGARIHPTKLHAEWQQLLNENDRIVITSAVELAKTSQVAIGRTLYELGHNPNLRVAIISNTNDLAKKITRQIGQYIQRSEELHEVFPNLVPTDDPALQWRAQALTVKRAGMGGKDPSIQASGMHGNIIGSRVDLLILDDVLDFENTNTPSPRDDAFRWIRYIMGRLSDEGRVWAVTNAWHPDDAMHRLVKEGFVGKVFPVMNPTTGVLAWPEKWPMSRIEKARGPGGMGPLEFARQLMCQARDDTSARFKKEWIDQCVHLGDDITLLDSEDELAMELGLCDNADDILTPEERAEMRAAAETVAIMRSRPAFNGGIITGVDLAVQAHSSADDTVLFTIYVDGKTGMRRVVSIRRGKWTGPEILDRIKECYRDFGGTFVIENVAAQHYIVQFLNAETAIPIIPFTTGRQKLHPEFGVESLATEMSNGKWAIPSRGGLDKETQTWISELLFYNPKEHTGDAVVASWLAREGARRLVDAHVAAGDVGVRTF